MSDYNPTPIQQQAIREYLHESIVPLIEDVLVKKLGQAMSYAAQELINPKREWVGLTDQEKRQILLDDPVDWINAIEQALKEKNT